MYMTQLIPYICNIKCKIHCTCIYNVSPYIVEVHCDAAPMVQFATVGQVSTLVDSVLNYTCLLGHKYPDGLHSQSVICTDTGQWIGPPLQEGCERKSRLAYDQQNQTENTRNLYV